MSNGMCKNYNIEVMVGASNATKKRLVMLFKPHIIEVEQWQTQDMSQKNCDNKCNNKHNIITKQKLVKE